MWSRAAAAVFVVLVWVAPGWAQELTWERLAHEGVERELGWYAGIGVGAEPAPVVLVLHGGGGSASQVWRGDDGRSWQRLADEHGLVLLLPEGRADSGNPDNHHWNDCRNRVVEPGAASAADDVGFLRGVLAWAVDRWPVDRDRVYVTGASNGGMMSFRMAVEAGNLIAAAAPIIANVPEPSECREPTRPIPMLIMNGTEDPLMPYQGGCVVSPRCERGAVLSTDESVDLWVDVDRTGSDPVCVDLPDLDPLDGSTVTVCTWSGGTAGSEVVLYRIDGGGHAVPGPDPIPWWYELIVGPKNHDIDAPEEIWTFFERHSRRPPAPRRSGGRTGH
jgi:polyhydroxybutyrate depolymerase